MSVWRHASALSLAALACTAAAAAVALGTPLVADAAEAPQLSHSQIETARRVMRSDTMVAHLFHGTAFHVAHLGPWSTGGARDRLIGVVLFVDLDRPVNAAGLWPETVYEPGRPFPSYSEHYEYFSVPRLRSAVVSVDLQRKKVADVRPGEHG
jgi:hypothetical protein